MTPLLQATLEQIYRSHLVTNCSTG